jgi:ATP-dependent DNA helicase DinG
VTTPNCDELIQIGMAAYDRVVGSLAGFRPREGQRAMALEVARAFAGAQLGHATEAPERRLALISAGTGVGKSIAYLTVGAAIAKARRTRLLLATSTVTLQEQICSKDLPMVAQAFDEPIRYVLAKGRGRYICPQKLQRRAQITEASLDFEDAEAHATPARAPTDARLVLFRSLSAALEKGSWNGDRDALPDPIAAEDWTTVAADRFSCTARRCPSYRSCPYYAARRELAQADVIVANHDLVLSSIGTRTLPELESCLVVFDEAHHLPKKALEHFVSDLDLSRVRWVEQAMQVLAAATGELKVKLPMSEPAKVLAELRACIRDSAQIIMDNLSSGMRERDGVRRLKPADIDAYLREPLTALARNSEALHLCCEELGDRARDAIAEAGVASPVLQRVYAALGTLAARAAGAQETAQLLLNEGEEAEKTAKWISVESRPSGPAVHLNASPIFPGETLALHLWHHVRGAVLTSATLTSCGNFDYFLSNAGLATDPAVKTAEVTSPFDYATQGHLVVRATAASPRNRQAFNAEVATLLASDIASAAGGGLALFTSRAHMEQTVAAVPVAARERLLIQGTTSRARLLAEHRRRVADGLPSVLMGLQQFGEGLDLPGELCAHVWIAKIPFETPDDPVGEARAEYMQAHGGDYFDEVVVPAAGERLLQWSGRAIRTESDQAKITVFDQRLLATSFGKRILRGLPPYPVQRLAARESTIAHQVELAAPIF